MSVHDVAIHPGNMFLEPPGCSAGSHEGVTENSRTGAAEGRGTTSNSRDQSTDFFGF